MKKAALLATGLLLLVTQAFPAAGQQVYSTWRTMELDKLASLWLIKRFVDPAATFRFYPQGAMDLEGIPVDTPSSQFRRTHRQTAYESLLKKHTLSDPALLYIGRLVRDVELNTWGEKQMPESRGVDMVVKGLIMNNNSPQECIEKGFIIMDALYKVFSAKK